MSKTVWLFWATWALAYTGGIIIGSSENILWKIFGMNLAIGVYIICLIILSKDESKREKEIFKLKRRKNKNGFGNR